MKQTDPKRLSPAVPQGAALRDATLGQQDDGLPAFDDLQPFFDDSCRRIASILDCPEAKHTTLNKSGASTCRSRMIRAWGIFAILCAMVSIYWGMALWRYSYDTYLHFFTLFLEIMFIALAADATVTTLDLLRHAPARVGLDSMLRHTRRMGLASAHLQQGKCSRHAPVQQPSPALTDAATRRNSQFSGFIKYTRAITLGLTASVALILVSCSTVIGDDHIMTQNHQARLESVATVTNMLKVSSINLTYN